MDIPSSSERSVRRRVSAFLAEHWLLLGILACALVLRCYHLNHPQNDFLNWRETQTLMVARNFLREGMNLFRPAVDWRNLDVSPIPRVGIVGGTELQITPWLTACLYHVFGVHCWVERLIPIAFSLFGLVFFYRLVYDFYGKTCAILATLCLSLSPFHLFCGRAQMPESLAFTSMYAALYFYVRYCTEPTRGGFAKAAGAATLMLLAKPQMCIAAVPMLYATWARWGWRAVLRRGLYVMLMCIAIPVGAFTWYSCRVLIGEAGLYFVNPSSFVPALGKYLTDLDYFRRMASLSWSTVIGPVPCILAALGILVVPRCRREGFALAWLGGALLFLLLFPALNYANVYYQMMLAPPAALLAGRLLSWLAKWKWLMPLALVGTAAACATELSLAKPLFDVHDGAALACGTWIREHTAPDTLVYCTNPSPTTLYFADRKGWTSWMGGLRIDQIERARTCGAQIVAVPDDYFDMSSNHRYPDYPVSGIRDWLYDRFACDRAGWFFVFDMNRSADLSMPANGCVQMGTPSCRRYLRGQWEWNGRDEQGPFTWTGPVHGTSTIKIVPPGGARTAYATLFATQPCKIDVSVNKKTHGRLQLDTAGKTVDFEVPFDGLMGPDGVLTLDFTPTDNTMLAFLRLCVAPCPTP